MWRYYQTREKGPWLSIKDSPRVVSEAIEQGARKLTILATSNNLNGSGIESEEELEQLRESCKYKGPLYFDIDNKSDIGEAIRSAQVLVQRLSKEMGVAKEAVRVYCSGSKGLHVIVDSRTFCNGRSIKHLPLVYKEMARDLHVLGMDFQVYSEGKGVSWRLPNLKRDDGNYRVELSHEELAALTPASYKQYVAGPRPVQPEPEDIPQSVRLQTLFERAKRKVSERPKQVQSLKEEQLEPIKEVAPPCIEMIADGKVKESANFNEIGMQIAIYGSRTGMATEKFSSLASRTADNNHSSQYNTERQRRDHLIGLYQYVATTPRYRFACAPMRALTRTNPCENCPINQGIRQNLEDEVGVFVKDNSYCKGTRDNPIVLTNFVMHGEEAMYELPNDGSDEKRTGLKLIIKTQRGLVHKLLASEDMWKSKSSLISQLTGYSDLLFQGNDIDVQKLKALIMSREDEMGRITRIHTAGIHFEKVLNRLITVYVENNHSINYYKVQDTHTLVDVPDPVPTLLPIEDWHNKELDRDRLDFVLSNLLRSNSDQNVAEMAGWFTACHLKKHIQHIFHQFPLMSIWGAAGSGKTETATLWLALNGVSYHGSGGSSAFSVPGMSKFALTHQCSSTTTIPRILDEYNQTKMSKELYTHAGEIMKASWSGQSTARGTINRNSNLQGRSGATSVQIEITAPLVILSEQSPGLPAFRQRSVSVYLTRANRDGCTAQFLRAKEDSDTLLKMAEILVKRTLFAKGSEISEAIKGYQKDLNPKLDDRPKFSYAVLKYGLQFLQETCEELGLPDSMQRVIELRECLNESLNKQSSSLYVDSMQSEIDRVMVDVIGMIDTTESGIERCIIEATHYQIMGDALRLSPSFHTMYLRYMRRMNRQPDIDRFDQFKTLVEQEPYCVSVEGFDPNMGGCIELSIKAMQNKNIDVNALKRVH